MGEGLGLLWFAYPDSRSVTYNLEICVVCVCVCVKEEGGGGLNQIQKENTGQKLDAMRNNMFDNLPSSIDFAQKYLPKMATFDRL